MADLTSDTNRATHDAWIAEMVASLPPHLVARFQREAAERTGETPLFTRDVVEVYPPAGDESKVRHFTPGIIHWEWADGSGFPERPEERYTRRVQERRMRKGAPNG